VVGFGDEDGARMAGIYLRGKTWWGRVQKDGQDLRQSLETRSESVARGRLKVWLDELETPGAESLG
jgi:hypothetical protein